MDIEPDIRVCSICGESKSADEFYTSVRASGRVDRYGKCKSCHNRHVAGRRRQKIEQDPDYLERERRRVAVYRGEQANRDRANKRSTASHEALSRLKARYPAEFADKREQQLSDTSLRRSIALYRATRELRDAHIIEYKTLYREALKRKGVT